MSLDANFDFCLLLILFVKHRFAELETDKRSQKLAKLEEQSFMQDIGDELIFMLTKDCAITEPPPRFMSYIY